MVKMLSIGNSFSHDALAYFRDIAMSAGLEVDVWHLSIGGCPLERHYNNMVSGIKKALMGYNGFNTAFETVYHKLGAPLKTDEIRRDANDLIRYFCYARNSIGSPPQQEEFENTLKSMQNPNEIVIKQETIDRLVVMKYFDKATNERANRMWNNIK